MQEVYHVRNAMPAVGFRGRIGRDSLMRKDRAKGALLLQVATGDPLDHFRAGGQSVCKARYVLDGSARIRTSDPAARPH